MVRVKLEENLNKFTHVVRDAKALNLGVLNCKGSKRSCSLCEMIVTERMEKATWSDKEWTRECQAKKCGCHPTAHGQLPKVLSRGEV